MDTTAVARNPPTTARRYGGCDHGVQPLLKPWNRRALFKRRSRHQTLSSIPSFLRLTTQIPLSRVRIAKEIPNPQFVGNPKLSADTVFRKNDAFFVGLPVPSPSVPETPRIRIAWETNLQRFLAEAGRGVNADRPTCTRVQASLLIVPQAQVGHQGDSHPSVHTAVVFSLVSGKPSQMRLTKLACFRYYANAPHSRPIPHMRPGGDSCEQNALAPGRAARLGRFERSISSLRRLR